MRIAIINCYFGKLPNYFDYWEQSAINNPTIDFILFSDCDIDTKGSTNLIVYKMSFEQLKSKINKKLSIETCFSSPYKLTDFKPAFGVIFEDELKSYDYWGYCDIDLVFGNLSFFLQQPIKDDYLKIYNLGHLTLYKNCESMNNLFKSPGSPFSYLEVFSNPEFYSFDEHVGMMKICKENNINTYSKEDMADVSCRLSKLTISRHKNYKYQVFYYENGSVFRAYLSKANILTEEFIYIHFQKRKLIIQDLYPRFYFLHDSIIEKNNDGAPSIDELKKYSENRLVFIGFFEKALFYCKKMISFLKSSKKQKKIWIEQKKAENIV